MTDSRLAALALLAVIVLRISLSTDDNGNGGGGGGGDPECQTDADCPDGFICVDGTCVEADDPEPECQADADCPDGFICVDGQCVEDDTPECQSDADCPEGFICVDGECVEDDGGGGGGEYPAGSPVARHGQLSVSGSDIVGEHGNPVQLTGMSTHGLQWFSECHTESAFDALADDWRADIVRVAMYVQSGGYEDDPAGFTQRVKDIINMATERGLYALVDFHILDPGDPMYNVDNAVAFFEDIAATYADHDNVLYEICNEPNGTHYDSDDIVDWDRIVEYADHVVPAIRAHDPDGIVIIGTPGWSSLGFAQPGGTDERDYIIDNQYPDDNVAYTYHFYADTHGGWERGEIDWTADQLPLFVTECGGMSANGDGPINFDSIDAWFDVLANNSVGWAYWTYSDDFRTSGVWHEGTCEANGPWTVDSLKDPEGTFIRDEVRAASDWQ